MAERLFPSEPRSDDLSLIPRMLFLGAHRKSWFRVLLRLFQSGLQRQSLNIRICGFGLIAFVENDRRDYTPQLKEGLSNPGSARF